MGRRLGRPVRPGGQSTLQTGETPMRAIMTVLAAAAATGLAALPAPADEATTDKATALCTQRDLQFMFAFKFRASFPQAKAAQALHRDGVAQCDSGNPEAGAAALAEALRKINVEPAGP